jgi:hypothetical protein
VVTDFPTVDPHFTQYEVAAQEVLDHHGGRAALVPGRILVPPIG